MLSGLKFIPRDKIERAQNDDSDNSLKEKKKSTSRKAKDGMKTKSSRYSSSDDEDIQRIKKRSSKKKWYSSDEYSSGESAGNSDEEENNGRDKRKSRSKGKRGKGEILGDDSDRSKKKSRHREDRRRKSKDRGDREDITAEDLSESDEGTTHSMKEMEIVRKEMGLEWMLRPAERRVERPVVTVDNHSEETPTEEINKVHPKELNPYLKDNGSGYPEDINRSKTSGDQLLSSVVGDGGASWRLKALKRAQEQAAREGRRLEEVVEERWDSLGQLAVSVASRSAAPSRAHLRAINDRKRGEQRTGSDNQSETVTKKGHDRHDLKDVPFQHHKMREPKVRDSLSWGRRKNQNMSSKDAGLISSAVSSLNRFANDGSFIHTALRQQNNDPVGSVEGNMEMEFASSQMKQSGEGIGVANDALSANQLAAKAIQLRMKGKHEEADKLLQEAEEIKAKQGAGDNSIRLQNEGNSSRYIMQDRSVRRKKDEDDADMHLARNIMHNKQFTTYGQADDEYDFDDGPSRKAQKKGGGNEQKVTQKNMRLLTQQERCLFCFENPKAPKHLIVSIAQFTYLMLPHWQPIVPGHCCIVPLQHESATRIVEDNVWEEIRNFKKCLIMMFAKQEKDVVFLETVMSLAQRRHCLIECIPLPREIAQQAPLYFKKAIDEAEDEWSQHNAKKLIDTSQKGLRGSIPKNFPYFHVEFGLYKGFVHVIDDEKQFKSSLGLNVIRGMLQLPEEDMHRRRRYESIEVQREAVKSFVRDWEPFDWTKQLRQAS
ncbi:CWF19-like protein 2 isoform X1 [Juglans regia]|uniref:CWF19-like protein 2 isoform X1 n=1 Tax=Juglans regia TaxID=51240 RepID=A0A6P9E5X0_JUGRE|nr:CWF19-like protein 2 isoform X1 [Juglans regia]XP_035542900.1 CWF19-like protein 2 isoform X1 [Juglans regia]